MSSTHESKRKSLTKNARWIVLWVRLQADDIIGFKPYETILNIGRWPYVTPVDNAIAEALDFSGEKILASQVYLVDVSAYPYAKQHKEVTALAERYFKQLENKS